MLQRQHYRAERQTIECRRLPSYLIQCQVNKFSGASMDTQTLIESDGFEASSHQARDSSLTKFAQSTGEEA